MNEWQDETLVAIESQRNGKYKVLELPARQTDVLTSRRSFKDHEQAETYIDDQYPTAMSVQIEDIQEEKSRRQAIQ